VKLGTRVTLAVTTVTVVTLAIASATTLFLVRREELADLDRALSAQAHLTANVVAIGDPRHIVLEPGSADVPEHLEPTPEYIAVYDADGTVLAASSSFDGKPPAFARLEVGTHREVSVNLERRGEPLRGVVVRVPGTKQRLLYAASRSEVIADVRFLVRVLALLLVLGTGATTVVALWLGRRLSRDVLEIAQVARDVANGNLGARTGGKVQGSAETTALAADLDHMIQHLASLVMAQRTFISHAAHELMSPLSTLRGELQLALRRPRSAEHHEQTIQQALGDVEVLVTLAEDLLTLARVENTPPAAQDTRVLDVVKDALRAAKGKADARRATVVSTFRGVEPETSVLGARRELARALRNLVDNAVLHSEPGAEVSVIVTATPTEVLIAVEDAGPGVPAADRPHVFDPFFRGARDRGDTDQGVGLGLAIAREIARRFGGDVELDEGHAPGARFALRLSRFGPP
jgi:two-component system heavy metal sensor histidine kinase CusS